MSSSSVDTLDKAVSTTAIIAAVVGTVFGIISCIGFIVIIICIIKHCNKPRGAVTTNGIILGSYPQYPNNAPYYPPYTNNVPNYPPQYPPSYTTLQSEFNKIPDT